MNERYTENEGKELKEYWYILLSNKYLFLTIFLFILVAVIVVTKIQAPIYQANATILIQQNNYDAQILALRNLTPRTTIINNHIEMLKSRTLIRSVVSELEKFGRLDSLPQEWSEYTAGKMVGMISANMSVIPIKDTDILNISFRDRSPHAAYFIAKMIADQYYQLNLEMTRGELSEVRTFLESQMHKIETELNNAEDILKKYKEQTKVVALSEETNMLVNTLAGFQQQYKSQEIELQTQIKRLDILSRNLSDAQKSLAKGIVNTSSPTIARLIEEVSMLESEIAKYTAQGYSKEHPKIVELNKKISNIKLQLMDESKRMISENENLPVMFSEDMIDTIIKLQINIETKKSLLSTLKGVIDEYEKQLNTIPVKELELARLERDKRVAEELYLLINTKYEESKIAEAGKLGSVRIIDYPTQPSVPILPKTKRNIVLGFFLALIIAAGVVFLKEYIDDSIKNIDELERTLKIKVIGTIPSIVLKNGDNKDIAKGKYRRYLLDDLPSGSPVTEAYKILRTNIIYLKEGKLKSITVSSSTKGEGKSTTALNLAITLSQLNRKVLLVDADLRKPILSKVLEIDTNSKGLTDLIKMEDNYHAYVRETRYKNLYFVSHGAVTLNSTEMFESHKMRHIIKGFEEDFDFVIYDTPPILSVADPRIIARYTDGLLWIVQYKKAKKQELLHTKKLLSALNTNTLGFVVNNVNLTGPYGNYYYNYYYHYYSEDKS